MMNALNKAGLDRAEELLVNLDYEFDTYRRELGELTARTVRVADGALSLARDLYRLTMAQEPTSYTRNGYMDIGEVGQAEDIVAELQSAIRGCQSTATGRHKRLSKDIGRHVDDLLVKMTTGLQ